jgi:hypothetical protein
MADKNNTNKTKTLQDIANYTFTKGINTETSPETQPESTYRAALNVVKETENEQNFLATEYSNEFRIKLPGKVLHSNLIKQLNKVVVFLHTNEIGLYDPNANTYTKLYANPDLNFSIYLESVSFTKTECEDIVLIFWDGVNRVRNINISRFLSEGPGDGPIEELDLFKTAETCITLSNVSFIENAAYNIDAGMYRPFIQYEDLDGNTTNYYIINENIPLIEDFISGTYQYIDGNAPKKLNKSIVLELDNVDTKYPFINIGFIKTVGGVPTSFIFKKTQPVSSSLKVTYEGDTTFDTGIDIAEVLNKRAFYTTAKHGLIYTDKLLLAGVKGIKQIDYQPIANKISVKYVTGRINLSRTKGYKNPEHIIHHKSWMRDENYMLGIVIEFEDMSESPAFPLINKKYPDFPDFTGPTGDRPITDDTKLCCTDSRQYWKEVNTAKRTSYNHFAGDLSINDFCSGTISNDSNNIRSEGYLGYFESEERYPIIPRCGVQGGSLDPKDYMYPTEVIGGKLFGQHITLFKMPDSTIEPFHNNLTDDYAIEENKNRFDSKYDSLEIYPLGLKLENVVMPTLEETGGVKATGYRIVYVRRDTFNKSIQDKGWFVEMFKNNFNGQDYIYPKHNVNAAAKWDYFSNLRDKTIETSSPIFDFVKNCGYGKHYDKGIMFYGGNTLSYQQGLNVNHVKIEQQYNSIGYFIDSIDGINTTQGGLIGDPIIDPSTFKDKDGRVRSSAVQIYNLYDYGYVQNNDGSINRTNGYKNRSLKYNFKNICTNNYSYVNDNVILNKILNTEFSLVNFYRESGVYLDYQLKSDLSFHNSLGFFNSDTSSKKCGLTSGGGGPLPFPYIIIRDYIIKSSTEIELEPQLVGTFNLNDIYFVDNPGLIPGLINPVKKGDSFKVTGFGPISGFPSKQKIILTKLNTGSLSLIGVSVSTLFLQKIPNYAAEQSFTVATPSTVTYNNNYPVGTTITVSNSSAPTQIANTNTFIVTNSTTLTLTGGPPLTLGPPVEVFVTALAPFTPSGVTYFKDYIDNATVPNILDRCNHGYIYYGSIKNNLPRQYGSIDDMFFIDTGLKGCAGQETLVGFYGDSYINTFSFVRTGVTGMLEDSYIDDNSAPWMDRLDGVYTIQNIIGRSPTGDLLLNLYLAQKANVTLLNTVIESDVNLDLRYEGPTFNEVYYPKLSNGKYYLFSNRKNEYAEDCFLNTYFYELICRNDQDNCTSTNYDEVEYNDAYKNFHNNKINLNTDYNELNGMRYNLIKPINRTYKTCDCDTEFDNRIAISTADNQSVGRLNYSKFLKNSFVTLPHKEGKITNLFKENQILYAHTTDNIWRLLTLESKLQASTTQIYLGTNDFLSSQQLELFASNEGYMGLQDKRFKFQNNAGYFFIDLKTQSVNLMSGGKLDSISSYGMSGFFRSNFKKYFNSYQLNPDLKNVEINFGYDYRHKRLLMTDKGNDFTISYYPEDRAFYSFHSYLPMAYIQSRDTFFTQSDNYDLYIHEDNFNSYRKFYGVHYPSILDGVFTYHPLLYTNFNNMGLKIDAFENVNGQQVILQEPPTSVSIWNSHQHSGEIFIKTPVNEDYMSNVVLGNQPHHFVNGILYLNNFSNFVLDQSQPFLQGDIFKEPNNNVSFSKNWTEINRLESNFFNYRVKIDDKDLENLKFILKFTVLNYNISMR